MSRFRNTATEVVVSVDDFKDDRFVDGWELTDQPTSTSKTPAKKVASSKSSKSSE